MRHRAGPHPGVYLSATAEQPETSPSENGCPAAEKRRNLSDWLVLRGKFGRTLVDLHPAKAENRAPTAARFRAGKMVRLRQSCFGQRYKMMC